MVLGAPTVGASPVPERRLQAHRLQYLLHTGSVVVASRLSCSKAGEIFPDQGSNPCPLHGQADSYPLNHRGSPQSVLGGIWDESLGETELGIKWQVSDEKHVISASTGSLTVFL